MKLYTPKQIKEGIYRRYRMYVENNSRKELQKNHEFWNILTEYRERSYSTGCAYSDYWVLYNYIRNKKPKEVLECGTGLSTIAMAYAMMENEKEEGTRGRITSMEELEEYFVKAQELLPDNLRKYVEIILSSSVEDYHGVYRGMRYKNIPDRKYDFVYVDGPKTTSPHDGAILCDLDFVKIVERSDIPVSGFIDKRYSTCLVMQSIFGDDKVYFDYNRGFGVLDSCSKDDIKTTDQTARDRMVKKRTLRPVSLAKYIRN